jgi:dTMP kinase
MEGGKYIVIEGGEGCGKTVQSELLFNYLSEKNIKCYLGREPGGIKAAEDMRNILKHNLEDISPIGEVFGFEFARAEFFDKIVIPKLKEGVTVISDRSGYSTLAYQGYAGGVPLKHIRYLNSLAMYGILPDLAIIIDINPEKGLEKEVVKDRFSEKGIRYHNKIRKGFLQIAKDYPNCKIIPYIENGLNEMQNQIRRYVESMISQEEFSEDLCNGKY